MESQEENINDINSLTELDKGDEFDSLLLNNINKYYKLKNEYQEGINQMKQSILNNKNLSRKERKKIYEEYKPKCIACGCEGGTKFWSYKNENEARILEAYCKCSNKCNFRINLNLGSYNIMEHSIRSINDELNEIKKQIIVHKNDTLFGVVKENSNIFERLINNLEQLNSEYTDYFEYNTMFNDNTVSEENVRLSENELIRTINTFDDAMMSNYVLNLLNKFQNNNLFIENSITFTNYFVCNYFIRSINNEINKMKEMDNYYDLTEENNLLDFRKKKALIKIKELFDRIVKYKYGKIHFKRNVKGNDITFVNNFANITEINETGETKINDFIIDVKNINVNSNNNLQTKSKKKKNKNKNKINIKIEEEYNNDENVKINENTINIKIDDEEQNNENEVNDEDKFENEIDDEVDDEDEDEDEDEDYKKEPISIGKETELEEMEELK